MTERDPAPSSSVKGEFAIGDLVDGRYQLRRDLGRGAAGRVFEAVHGFTGRSVALKLVTSDAPPSLRAELHIRLAREARALAAVRHPGVVTVLDGGILPDGMPYLVMEMLEGRTLEGLIAARGRVTVEDTVALGIQLANGLDAAHAAGIVHRDVKPSNVVIVEDHRHREVAKIVDFGIARVAAEEEEKLTSLGALIGTPGYMAPEQLLGQDDIDSRSDVYALGVVLFECLTGRMPYDGTYQRVLLRVCSNEPVPEVDSPDAPAELVRVVRRAMSKERTERFASMNEMGDALRSSIPAERLRRDTQFFGPPPTQRAVAPAAPPAAQRRKLVRAPYVTPLRLVAGGTVIDGRSEDISTGGVLVICRQACQANQAGTLRFALPMEGTVVTLAVAVRWARAARENDPDGLRAMGVEFVDPPAAVVESLARYVGFMTAPEA
jgi:serine/threonine-protein kinase